MTLNIDYIPSPHPSFCLRTPSIFGSSAAQKQSLSNLCCCQDLTILCAPLSIAKVRSSSQRALVSRCGPGRGLQTCQSYPLLHCPLHCQAKPAARGDVPRLWGKGSPVLSEVTHCSAGSSFPVFMLHPLTAQPCFPCYALMPAKEPKPALLWICCGDLWGCWPFTLMLLKTGSTLYIHFFLFNKKV